LPLFGKKRGTCDWKSVVRNRHKEGF